MCMLMSLAVLRQTRGCRVTVPCYLPPALCMLLKANIGICWYHGTLARPIPTSTGGLPVVLKISTFAGKSVSEQPKQCCPPAKSLQH